MASKLLLIMYKGERSRSIKRNSKYNSVFGSNDGFDKLTLEPDGNLKHEFHRPEDPDKKYVHIESPD